MEGENTRQGLGKIGNMQKKALIVLYLRKTRSEDRL